MSRFLVSARSRRQEWNDPASQRRHVARLNEHAAAAGELADQSLARKQERLGAADAAHAEIEGAVERHDVPRVNHELTVDGHLGNAAVAIDEHVTLARAL